VKLSELVTDTCQLIGKVLLLSVSQLYFIFTCTFSWA